MKAEPGSTTTRQLRARSSTRSSRAPTSMLASTDEERDQLASLYGADPDRIEIVPPGVDHALFSPGDRAGAPRRLGLDRPPRAAVRRPHPAAQGRRPRGALPGRARRPDVHAGRRRRPERPRRRGRARARSRARRTSSASATGCASSPPQPHDAARRLLPRRRRVPRAVPHRVVRLVALEAAACGTPVVAAAVGGLRSLVDDGGTGFLVDGRDPVDYADADRTRSSTTPIARPRWRERGRAVAALHVEHRPPARLRRLYADLAARELVRCRLSRSTSRSTKRSSPRSTRSIADAPRRAGRARSRACRPSSTTRDPALVRALRVRGRDAATIYFDLHQRTLRYEVYFLPDPPAHHDELYRFLLRRNHEMYGAHFSIGPDGDCYLVGRVAARAPRRRASSTASSACSTSSSSGGSSPRSASRSAADRAA